MINFEINCNYVDEKPINMRIFPSSKHIRDFCHA